jgi:hypothetical protein
MGTNTVSDGNKQGLGSRGLECELRAEYLEEVAKALLRVLPYGDVSI